MTGQTAEAPSSAAFSATKSIRARLIGANSSHRSGSGAWGAAPGLDRQTAPALAEPVDPRRPLAVAAVEQRHAVAPVQPQHVAQIMGALVVKADGGALAQRFFDIQAGLDGRVVLDGAGSWPLRFRGIASTLQEIQQRR